MLAIPPPRIRTSTFFSSSSRTLSFPETFAPPTIAANGLAGLSMSFESIASSRSIRKPAYAGRSVAMPTVLAWARWAVPKASFTYSSA